MNMLEERRMARFSIPSKWLENTEHAKISRYLTEIFEDMIVVFAAYRPDTDSYQYTAYHNRFDPVVLGSKAPYWDVQAVAVWEDPDSLSENPSIVDYHIEWRKKWEQQSGE